MRPDWNGHPKLSSKALRAALLAVNRHVPLLYVTATTDGVHASGSYHYQSRAWDGGSDRANNGPEKKAQKFLLDKYGPRHFKELFGPLPWYVKDGRVYPGVFPGHSDHLHVAI